MAQVCSKCSTVNPNDAVYCYKDGNLLQSQHASTLPRSPGIQPFPYPFVFPSGEQCQNFDQLAMTCCRQWGTALNLLREGYLGSFMRGLGRTDLATAATSAAQHPDADRGLDDFLGHLPAQVLQIPKLQVSPREVNLGVVAVGEDRSFALDLTNQGMRLLHGTISVSPDYPWLTVGDLPGVAEKYFQFISSCSIPVNVVGENLRAGPKPMVGELAIRYAGGSTLPIKVRLEVPVKPFSKGVLGGATSPREIAEKARTNPHEAAKVFDSGEVAAWFRTNGWVYPVQGQAASGIGAIQQFFEALGLAKAPQVKIDKAFLSLEGRIEESLLATLEVRTAEKKHVYAHATSNQPWLVVSPTKLEGRAATIHLSVPQVPNAPGHTLTATVQVAANGNQRFSVPVSLRVLANPNAPAPRTQTLSGLPTKNIPSATTVPAPTPGPPTASPVVAVPAVPDASQAPLAVGIALPPLSPETEAPSAGSQSITAVVAHPINITTSQQAQAGFRVRQWIHLVPLGVLFLALVILILVDFFGGERAAGAKPKEHIDSTPLILINYDYAPFYPSAVVRSHGLQRTMKFGILTGQKADAAPIPDQEWKNKKLTSSSHGLTNTVVVRVNAQDFVFGHPGHGYFASPPKKIHNKYNSRLEDTHVVWSPNNANIRIEQSVAYVLGEVVATEGKLHRRLDTCLVRYKITNEEADEVDVGLRFMLDTLIGTNDGVPFTVPGTDKLVDRMQVFDKLKSMPEVILALERANLKEPGTVAQLNLKVGDRFESPPKVLLTRWPFRHSLLWDIPLRDFQRPSPENPQNVSDSAVVMYWPVKALAVGRSRTLGFAYGLGVVTSDEGTIGIHVSPNLLAKRSFRVTGFFTGGAANRQATLRLPDGLRLAEGDAQRPIPRPPQVPQFSHVSWKVVANAAGAYTIRIDAGVQETQERRIVVRSNNLFN